MENENVEFDKCGIGEDVPLVAAKRVVIEDYKIEMVKNKAEKEIGNKLTLIVQHPDITDRKIEISGVKYEVKGKLKDSGLWVKLDENKNLPFRSAVAHLLRFLKKNKIADLKGDQVDTIQDDNGYLVVKAY